MYLLQGPLSMCCITIFKDFLGKKVDFPDPAYEEVSCLKIAIKKTQSQSLCLKVSQVT